MQKFCSKKCFEIAQIEYSKIYHQINKIKISKYNKEQYVKNLKKILKRAKIYREEHIEEIKEKMIIYRSSHKDEISEQAKSYKKINRTAIRQYENYLYTKDINYRISKCLRSRILIALKRNSKSASTIKLLGCSIEFFKSYYESKFTKGMSWAKVMNGEIHIDHLRPCASFDLSKPSEQRKCFHYTNLQPLWAEENLKKSDKYDN